MTKFSECLTTVRNHEPIPPGSFSKTVQEDLGSHLSFPLAPKCHQLLKNLSIVLDTLKYQAPTAAFTHSHIIKCSHLHTVTYTHKIIGDVALVVVLWCLVLSSSSSASVTTLG